ncbi:MAG TPA: ribbon-helix-helix domain-containing protein [Vicinamibacteria bacterium]|nr:ribbon-helix-helix domain-containing protein [Vicinamibacteria bacterium]
MNAAASTNGTAIDPAETALLWNRVWSRFHSMETIQVVMEEGLLKAADQAARRLKVNRSALIRDAVREHLKRLRYRELERQEREAYERIPDDPAEFAAWDKVASWPQR